MLEYIHHCLFLPIVSCTQHFSILFIRQHHYSNLDSTQNCEKCAELEFQLQLVHDELSSVQLIIQMINKEEVQKDPITTPTNRRMGHGGKDTTMNCMNCLMIQILLIISKPRD